MSTDRDTTRIVRSWLEEGVTALPDRVLDAVLDQVPATPQRRSWWPARRTPTVNNYARLGLVAAAALAVAIGGIGFLGRPSNVGPSTAPTPSPIPSLSPTRAAAINPLVGRWLAPEVTCAQQIATIEAAGYTAEQATQNGFDPTCGKGNIGSAARSTNRYSLVFDGLPLAATILSARVYDFDVVASPHMYRLAGDSTFELGGHDGKVWEYCLTFRYAIDGDQLTIDRIDPSCAGTEDAPLLDQIALTAILETSSFTRQP